MLVPNRFHGLIPALMILGACTDPPPEPRRAKSDHTWSDRQEVIYQLREVIRYEDDQERLRLEALRSLDLPVDTATPAKPAVTTGKRDDQDHQ